jgi:hypothetical protein
LYSRRPETGDGELAIFPFHDLQLAPKILHFPLSQLTTDNSLLTPTIAFFQTPVNKQSGNGAGFLKPAHRFLKGCRSSIPAWLVSIFATTSKKFRRGQKLLKPIF